MIATTFKRVLALDVRPRSFGFVVFEGPNRLLNWGAKSFRSGRNAAKIPPQQKIIRLLDYFSPFVVMVREREKHVDTARILVTIQHEAANRRISFRFISQKAIKGAFIGTEKNKHQVASALADHFAILVAKLPPKRKCWQNKDYRMTIFDAAAAGAAYFSRSQFRASKK